jgi:CRP-like cAMP-binding protein
MVSHVYFVVFVSKVRLHDKRWLNPALFSGYVRQTTKLDQSLVANSNPGATLRIGFGSAWAVNWAALSQPVWLRLEVIGVFNGNGLRWRSSKVSHPRQNQLLAALPQCVKKQIFPNLKLVHLPLGKVIYEADQEVRHVYFPSDCIISLIYVLLDGHSAEISVVGREGIVGVTAFMGGASTTSRAVVQSAGSAYRLPASEIRNEFENNQATRMLMLIYTQSLITQMAQTAICNRLHTILQQLCRWLLLSLDRLPSNELVMTQELIANMLGVRREGVTEAACKLQKLGVIDYRRGHITVIDRPKLESLCCECYAVAKKETDRLAVCAEHL